MGRRRSVIIVILQELNGHCCILVCEPSAALCDNRVTRKEHSIWCNGGQVDIVQCNKVDNIKSFFVS